MSTTITFLLIFIIALSIGVFIGRLIFSSKSNSEKLILEEKINSLNTSINDLKNQMALEKLSFDKNQSQLFIETPYRNNKLLEDILQTLQPNTLLCIACDITLPTEYIKTMTVNLWKKQKVDLHNRPCIFIIHKTY